MPGILNMSQLEGVMVSCFHPIVLDYLLNNYSFCICDVLHLSCCSIGYSPAKIFAHA